LTTDLGHSTFIAGEPRIALDTEHHERRQDQQNQNELKNAGVFANEIEHGG